jgi:hypothetical protein
LMPPWGFLLEGRLPMFMRPNSSSGVDCHMQQNTFGMNIMSVYWSMLGKTTNVCRYKMSMECNEALVSLELRDRNITALSMDNFTVTPSWTGSYQLLGFLSLGWSDLTTSSTFLWVLPFE